MNGKRTDDVDEALGGGVAVLVVGDARIFARLVAAEAVVEHEARPVADDLVVVAPEVVGVRIGGRLAVNMAADRALLHLDQDAADGRVLRRDWSFVSATTTPTES